MTRYVLMDWAGDYPDSELLAVYGPYDDVEEAEGDMIAYQLIHGAIHELKSPSALEEHA